MSSRYSRQCWEHFRGRNEVHSRWFRNTMDHSTPAPSMSGCVPRLLCTGVFPFQSGADNHINHQAMMRFQRADSHEPHWYSTFCMTVWHKRELLLSLLFCAPWFPHQNKEIIILVPAHFLWTLTDWKAIKCVKAIWKLSAAQQGGTTVANCHILSKKKKKTLTLRAWTTRQGDCIWTADCRCVHGNGFSGCSMSRWRPLHLTGPRLHKDGRGTSKQKINNA